MLAVIAEKCLILPGLFRSVMKQGKVPEVLAGLAVVVGWFAW
jgi:hypothetical protein